ncbi:MAG: hypothetical protein CUN55_06710 [Phototrophicales bacterium]|nr:MAG: hypothetical protein CUN55_06710 [Phototrophicales bacterium]
MQLPVVEQFITEHRQGYALLIGAFIGILSAIVALMLVLAGPVMTFGFVFAVLIGLIALSNLEVALLVILATATLLPYGTLPFDIAVTPSLLDVALGTFLVVYLFQWMTGRRHDLRLSWVHGAFLMFLSIILLAFVLGVGNAPLTPGILRRFLGLLVNIALALVIFDVVRTPIAVRRIAATLIILGTVSALIGTVLWLLPDMTAEAILNRLGRIGYPVGGVIRYREDGVTRGIERAIGTWIDPNAFGGCLMMIGALTAPQLLAKRTVFGYRFIAFILMGIIGIGLFLTNSRGSLLGLVAGVGVVALLRYRRLIWLMIFAGGGSLLLPPVQDLIQRYAAGFSAADLETQMRLGEYGDALELISRYPVIGVGFSAPPDIDLYLGVASTYLTIATNAGIVGLAAYLATIGSVFFFGYRGRKTITADDYVNDVWFGFLGGIIGALVSGIFDHFYFNIQFQATSLIFWFYVGMFLAIIRICNPLPDTDLAKLARVPIVKRFSEIE